MSLFRVLDFFVTRGGGEFWLVRVVLSMPVLVDEDDEDKESPVDGSSSPAVSVVCRGVGEDGSNVVGGDDEGGCSDACDVSIDCWSGLNLLSIAELISSLRKRLKSPLMNSLNSILLLSNLSSILLMDV